MQVERDGEVFEIRRDSFRSCPLARRRHFPLHDHSAPRGARRLGQRDRGGRPARPHACSSWPSAVPRSPIPTREGPLPGGHGGARAPALPAPRRHDARAGRGHLPRPRQEVLRGRATSMSASVTVLKDEVDGRPAARGPDAERPRVLQRLRAPEPPHPRRGPVDREQHRRTRCSSAYTIAAHLLVKVAVKQEILEQEDLAERFKLLEPDAGQRARDSEARAQDRGPGAEPGSQEPEGVLPQRAAQGDPQGAGVPERVRERDRGARRQQVKRAKMPKEVNDKAIKELDRLQKMSLHVAGGHRRAELRRLARVASVERADRGQSRHQSRGADPGRGPLRPEEGEGADRRVPGRAQALGRAQGPDSLLRRPAGRGEDLAREVDRARDGSQVRPDVPGRRPRRGGDPRATAGPTSARCPAGSSRE